MTAPDDNPMPTAWGREQWDETHPPPPVIKRRIYQALSAVGSLIVAVVALVVVLAVALPLRALRWMRRREMRPDARLPEEPCTPVRRDRV
jgi:hypothetical protein